MLRWEWDNVGGGMTGVSYAGNTLFSDVGGVFTL